MEITNCSRISKSSHLLPGGWDQVTCRNIDEGGHWWTYDGENAHPQGWNQIGITVERKDSNDPDDKDEWLLAFRGPLDHESRISVKCVRQNGSPVKKSTQTAIQEVSLIDFMVFPNPSAGNVTVALNLADSKAQSIKIVNIQGKVIYTQDVIDDNTDIDLNSITKGLYLVKVKSSKGQSVQKLIIK